jgi:hypothetical protein
VPLDTTDIQSVLRTFRKPIASPPNSVRAEAITMHEILGGTADGDRKGGGTLSLNARGYFAVWKAPQFTLVFNIPGAAKAGSNATPDPEVVILKTGTRSGVAGVPVRFRVNGGAGKLSDGTPLPPRDEVEVKTDGSGRAAVTWTLGPVVGVNELIVTGFKLNHTFRVTST